MDEDILLHIVCLAYNQKDYIRECLDGFVMQKTNFRFNAIVHDDASTDGTADIIREYAEKYPDIIVPVFEEKNQFFTGHIYDKVFPLVTGKYVAQCEGDDYWVDPYKLQKQVDYLEEHPDCTASCHRYYVREENENELTLQANKFFDSEEGRGKDCFEFDKKYLFEVEGVMQTLSMVFRTKEIPGLVKFATEGKYLMFRDVHIFYYLISGGYGVCHSFVGGVYRHNKGGIYSSKSLREQYFINSRVYLELALNTKSFLMLKSSFKQYLHGVTGKTRMTPIFVLTINNWLHKNHTFRMVL